MGEQRQSRPQQQRDIPQGPWLMQSACVQQNRPQDRHNTHRSRDASKTDERNRELGSGSGHSNVLQQCIGTGRHELRVEVSINNLISHSASAAIDCMGNMLGVAANESKHLVCSRWAHCCVQQPA